MLTQKPYAVTTYKIENLHSLIRSSNLINIFIDIYNRIVKSVAIKDMFTRATDIRYEPQIYARKTRSGETYFEVYDPYTYQVYIYDSEQKVRMWLERRY